MGASAYLRALGLQNGVLAVLRAALDASSCQPHWIYAVAGYVAPAEDWDPLLAGWQDALNQWKLKRFHLSELPELVGRTRTHMCEQYFARIIKESPLHSIGSAIFTADWEQPDWRGDATPRFSTPYEQSLWLALNVLAEHCELEFPGQPVAVLCDVDGPEVAMNAVFKMAQEKRSCLDSLAISNSYRHKELQCADLAAGFLRRSWVDITTDENCRLPWGVIPRSKKGRTSVWSLRNAAIITRSMRIQAEDSRESLLRQRELLEKRIIRTRFSGDGETDTTDETIKEVRREIAEIDERLQRLPKFAPLRGRRRPSVRLPKVED